MRDLLAIGVGVLGSIHSKAVQDSFLDLFLDFQRAWPPVEIEEISWPPTIFWLGVVVVGRMFHRRQRYIDRQHLRERAVQLRTSGRLLRQSEAIDAQTRRLEDVIRTLPGDDFLVQFNEIYPVAHVAFVRAVTNRKLEPEGIADTIRTLLHGTLLLVESFDPADTGVRYAANLMIYVPTESLTERAFENAKHACQAYPSLPFSRERTRGVLYLVPELSTSLVVEGRRGATGQPEPDPKLKPLCLPIPHETHSRHTDRPRVLPGAPLAYVEKNVIGYANTETMAKWCEEEATFDADVIREVAEYFSPQPDNLIRSLVSMPLPGDRLGVLNVHRDRPGMLHEQDPAKHLAPILQPIASMLRDLSHAYTTLRPLPAVLDETTDNAEI